MSDPKAAAIHRARAEQCYADAEHFRRLGKTVAEAAARAAARNEDRIAELLERGTDHTRDNTRGS